MRIIFTIILSFFIILFLFLVVIIVKNKIIYFPVITAYNKNGAIQFQVNKSDVSPENVKFYEKSKEITEIQTNIPYTYHLQYYFNEYSGNLLKIKNDNKIEIYLSNTKKQ